MAHLSTIKHTWLQKVTFKLIFLIMVRFWLLLPNLLLFAYLTIASSMTWHLKQLDDNNVFLHGNLEEDVYMTLPSSFRRKRETYECKFHKSLYGFKQVSCQWFIKLSKVLILVGFIQLKSDHSLFVRHYSASFTAFQSIFF